MQVKEKVGLTARWLERDNEVVPLPFASHSHLYFAYDGPATRRPLHYPPSPQVAAMLSEKGAPWESCLGGKGGGRERGVSEFRNVGARLAREYGGTSNDCDGMDAQITGVKLSVG